MLDKVIKALAYLVSLVLLGTGVRWLVAPEGAAAELGMPLLEGIGLSTQIGDLSAFFITAGGFGLAGLLTKKPNLLYTPAALVGLTAIFRTIAWLVHGAALAPVIVPELIMCAVFLLARTRLEDSQ